MNILKKIGSLFKNISEDKTEVIEAEQPAAYRYRSEPMTEIEWERELIRMERREREEERREMRRHLHGYTLGHLYDFDDDDDDGMWF